MNATAEPFRVLETVLASWRFLFAHPLVAFRTAWLPLALIVWLSLSDDRAAAVEPGAVLGNLATGAAVLAVLILALVAWQRFVLYGADRRRGLSALRLGRAELLSVLHFPLVEILMVPLQMWPLAVWLYSAPAPFGGGIAAWMPWIAFLVIVFPGGPYLTRAALMLAAIAASGGQRISLGRLANRVWSASAGATLRLYLIVMIAGLPIALVAQALDSMKAGAGGTVSQVAAGTVSAVLLMLYVLVVGGALARSWQALGGMDNGIGVKQSGGQ